MLSPDTNMRLYTYTIDEKAAAEGKRLDVVLTHLLPDLSRTYIQKLIASGQVTVNGRPSKAHYRVRHADRLTVMVPPPPSTDIEPEDIPLDIIYEDDVMMVINKARGMVVHPAAGNYRGTLVNALLGRTRSLSSVGGLTRPGIVHRLDKDTSGVMVVAKTDAAHRQLAAQIKLHRAGRIYVAIVHGDIAGDVGVINAPIGRHPVDRKRMAVVKEHGRPAVTHFRILERLGEFTLVECRLETGRTHQIRVHMAYIGHPVLGDPKYGPPNKRFAIAGQALHARELHIWHPCTGQAMVFTAPLPSDMAAILAQLRASKQREEKCDG